MPYLEPAPDAGRALFSRGLTGPVVMLNLVRLRVVADYSATPDLAPPTPISGAAAYDRYIAHTLPLLRRTGGDVIFFGQGREFLHWAATRGLGFGDAGPASQSGRFRGFCDGCEVFGGVGPPHRRHP